MSEQVKQLLREALADRDERFPYAQVADRLLSIDYEPRYRRRPTARLLGALAASGSAAVAVLIAVLLTVGGNPAPAFAGWTPEPRMLTSSQLSAVAHDVRDQWAPRCSGAGGAVVLADVRGPYTFALYVTNANAAVRSATICLNGVEHGEGSVGRSHRWPPPVAKGQIRGFITEYGQLKTRPITAGASAFTEVGRAGTGVRSVSVLLSTGKKVQATVAHGWYLAWWPAQNGSSKKLEVMTSTRTYDVPDANGHSPIPARTNAPANAGR